MTRMSLRFFVDEERGLCLTVRRTMISQGHDGEKVTTVSEKTDAWLPSSIGDAVAMLVTEYLDAEDLHLPPTPIEEKAGRE